MKQVESKNKNRMADEALDVSVRDPSPTGTTMIEICNKFLPYLLLRNKFNEALTYLFFYSFKCCESVVLQITVLEVARELSRFSKMARRSKVVRPR